ncbi:hypothetical protein [Chamaesiphon minutus]|uniref:Uncharacterized protein n=1 Tax=Chamaesiphon minutus (strain ATCC 27169 / PCC 6605) TaxID=1173020 RepID=K9UE64_CHAP6|nr:hypothetical protein [Chamaesiphon minutus]AFY92928.1 hypothetical protein Cha6605_1807 [Chamaesiphon minutus PCC 6605]
MSDNNIPESERRLQEIGNQLGTPILSPTTKIQADDGSVISSSQSNTDIQGTLDLQPSSKNPLLQYIVAGAIGLGAVGVPLTVLFGLGGTPTATKPTAPEVEDTTSSLADRELENLKTQSALDIQAKGKPQTVAQTPKPASTPTPSPTVAAQPPKLQPVVKTPAPQPRTIAVPPPTVVAATPATVARPVPIPVTRPVARPIPRPTPAPVIQQPRPTPIPVATQPTQPVRVKPVEPEQPPLSFEQASALGMFGGDNDKSDNGAMTLASDDSSALTLSLPVGANVAAHTVTPYTSLSRNSATNGTETPLSVQLDQPIQLSQGFNLPAGTIVQFGATVNDNGAVTATSRGVFIDGTEIKVPVGAFALTASNSAALVANQRSLLEGELSGADTTAAMWGAAGSVGKALVDSGNTSVVNTSGLGTSVVQTNNGGVNIPGALLNGAFSPLAKAKEARANALAQELQQSSKLNEIPVRSPVRVFVAAAATVTVPVSSDVTAANTGTPAQGQVLSGGDVEQPPTMIPTKPISAVNVQPVVAPSPPTPANTQPVSSTATPVTATTQPVVSPLPTTANIQPVVAPSPVTATTQPATPPTTQVNQGINTLSPIAPTKPNNVVNTQPTIAPIQTSSPAVTQPTSVVPTPVTTATQPLRSRPSTPTQLSTPTPTVTTDRPIVTAPSPTTPNPTTAITQPSVVPQSSNGVIAQPIATPTTIDRSFTNQSTLVPQQPLRTPATTTHPTFIPSEPTAVSPLVTTPQVIQSTTTRSTFIPPQSTTTNQPTPTPTQPIVVQQQPALTTQPVIVPSQSTSTTRTSPIAPTKPNNIVNTQPQSTAPSQAVETSTTPAFAPIPANSGIDAQSPPIITSTQLIEAQNTQNLTPIVTQPTTGGTPSGLIPIQFDNGGSIQPVTTQNPAMAPLP